MGQARLGATQSKQEPTTTIPVTVISVSLQTPSMSSLAKDAAAFKNTLQSANMTSWHSSQPSTSSSQPATTSDGETSKKKKRPKASMSRSLPLFLLLH